MHQFFLMNPSQTSTNPSSSTAKSISMSLSFASTKAKNLCSPTAMAKNTSAK